MLSPPKILDEIQQIWYVSYSHEWGVQQHFIFALLPGERSKGQIISLNFNYSQFQRFLYQTLCVFSQVKDIKHIARDFHSLDHAPSPKSQGWGLRVLCGQKFNFSEHGRVAG